MQVWHSAFKTSLVLAAIGCGVSHPWDLVPKPIQPPPSGFVADPAFVHQGSGCAVHLINPQDGTRLLLIRSADRGKAGLLGDYAVGPAGRYGVGPAGLLRLNCGTGQVLGIVTQEG